jgi:UDP-N-acetylmuramyl pentapeptide phosphotransferase/UDP-N-acetylglucosamine-1-phosphate transferase
MLIPFLKKAAIKYNFLDKPTERKKHIGQVPLLGGAWIFIGFMCGCVIFINPIDSKFLSIIIASTLVFSIGMVDDWYKAHNKEFPVMPRLIVHIISAYIVYRSGIIFHGFTNPLTHQYVLLPELVQFILSITWILGVTTVINWTDGMDGLAGGLTAISGSTLFIVALAKGQFESATTSILLIGSTLGFLRYNKHPAQIYMGDSGANFLGFILSVIALEGAFKQATLISIFIPILALGVPIFDNIFVVVKRFTKGKPIYQADRSQVHYRLLANGLNQKQVVTFLYLVSTCMSLLSIIILLLNV